MRHNEIAFIDIAILPLMWSMLGYFHNHQETETCFQNSVQLHLNTKKVFTSGPP